MLVGYNVVIFNRLFDYLFRNYCRIRSVVRKGRSAYRSCVCSYMGKRSSLFVKDSMIESPPCALFFPFGRNRQARFILTLLRENINNQILNSIAITDAVRIRPIIITITVERTIIGIRVTNISIDGDCPYLHRCELPDIV